MNSQSKKPTVKRKKPLGIKVKVKDVDHQSYTFITFVSPKMAIVGKKFYAGGIIVRVIKVYNT